MMTLYSASRLEYNGWFFILQGTLLAQKGKYYELYMTQYAGVAI